MYEFRVRNYASPNSRFIGENKHSFEGINARSIFYADDNNILENRGYHIDIKSRI
jgi:hypothetical protein